MAGARTPHEISRLEQELPDCYEEFINISERLERHYKDMQDIEFTIEQGKLYFLQTRNGKRTAKAALKIAVDLVKEGLISKENSMLMVDDDQLESFLHQNFDEVKLKSTEIIPKVFPA